MSTMLLTAAPTGYSALIAGDARLVEAAQRLRYRVFADELGARLEPGGIDVDDFDAYCDHLIVREDRTGEVVGTYRLLPPARALWLGRRYADTEFDLGPLMVLRDRLVEAGRTCVHPDHRTGAVINLMWAGIARYLDRFGYKWLGGCASVPLSDAGEQAEPAGPPALASQKDRSSSGADQAAAAWDLVQRKHMSPPALRVKPHLPWVPFQPSKPGNLSAVPPLFRGYLRLGAWVCGEPAYDPAFGCADFFLLLNVNRVNPRYLQHFLGR